MEKLEVDAAPTLEELEEEKENEAYLMDDRDRYITHLLEEIDFLRGLLRDLRLVKPDSAVPSNVPKKQHPPVQQVKTWRSVAARMREAEQRRSKDFSQREAKEIIHGPATE